MFRSQPPPTPNCGSDVTADSGSLSVPDLDPSGPYGGWRFCQWVITVPEGSVVNLQVKDFRGLHNCAIVSAYDGAEARRDNQIRELNSCHGLQDLLTSRGNQVAQDSVEWHGCGAERGACLHLVFFPPVQLLVTYRDSRDPDDFDFYMVEPTYVGKIEIGTHPGTKLHALLPWSCSAYNRFLLGGEDRSFYAVWPAGLSGMGIRRRQKMKKYSTYVVCRLLPLATNFLIVSVFRNHSKQKAASYCPKALFTCGAAGRS